MSRVAGYAVRAAPRISDPENAARMLLDELPSLRPGLGEDVLRARIDGKGGRLLRWRRHRAAFVLDASPVGPAHVKIYSPRHALDLAIETATPSRGTTSWKMGCAIAAAGLPTPEPLLLLVRKPFRLHGESVLVTARLENAVGLNQELKARAAAGQPTRTLLADVARLAADFHRAGFFHGDFTARNVLLAGPPADRRLWLIDLDRTKRLGWMPAVLRHRVQILDLRLLLLTTWSDVSRREWLRLLAIYLKRAGIPRARRRGIASAVLNARRGRVRLGASKPPLAGRDPWPQ